jgi:hypothetical protein
LTSVEQSLVEHVGRGERLDLAAEDEPVDEAAMRSWGESRTCRASVIRDILRGRLAADPDPHGLRLRGARIADRLDLENLVTDVSLELTDCLLEEGVLARNARLAGLTLTRCQFEHPAEPPLDGGGLTCSLVDLTGARVIGHADAGAVNLAGARIGSYLGCEGADLHNDSGPALFADRVQVELTIFLRDGFTATGSGRDGAVRLHGDNGAYEDAAIKKILSPYPDDRSAVTDCVKLLRSGFAGRRVVLRYGFEDPQRPLRWLIENGYRRFPASR